MIHINITAILPSVVFSAVVAFTADAPARLPEAPPTETDLDKVTEHERLLIRTFVANVEPNVEFIDDEGMVRETASWLGEVRTVQNRLTPSEFVTRATHAHPELKAGISPAGFADLIFPDGAALDIDRYDFGYRGNKVLGGVATWVFDIRPKPSAGAGAFTGTVWIAPRPDLQIVMYDGTFSRSSQKKASPYVHFIGVRNRVMLEGAPIWVPSAVFVDEKDLPKAVRGIVQVKAMVNVWGLHKRAEHTTFAKNLAPDDDPTQPKPKAGLQQRLPETFYGETERKVLDWLESIGLLGAPGSVDAQCEGVIYKLRKNAHEKNPQDLHCRVAWSTPLEWMVVGRTLVVSKTFFDLPGDEPTLAAMLAPAVAAALQDRPIQFVSDALLQNREEALRKLDFRLPAKYLAGAESRAIELLGMSEYRDSLSTAAVFQISVEKACDSFHTLFTPRFGNPIGVCNPSSSMRQLDTLAPRHRQGHEVLPLSARLRINPWTDEIEMLEPPLDDAPFRLVPINLVPRSLGDNSAEAPKTVFPPLITRARVAPRPPIR